MSTSRINRLIGLLMNAIKKAHGIRKEYYREALRCLNKARVYMAQGYDQTARYACERACFWYELAKA